MDILHNRDCASQLFQGSTSTATMQDRLPMMRRTGSGALYVEECFLIYSAYIQLGCMHSRILSL